MHLIPSAYQLLILAHVVHVISGSSNWWYLSQEEKQPDTDPRFFCELIPKVYRKQRQICRSHPQAVESVVDGVRNAIRECQHQFHSNKWNCSTFQHDPSVFGKYLVRGGTRELSFLHAITTASSILNLAKDCAMGKLACECSGSTNIPAANSKEAKAQFNWHGCPQTVIFGIKFVRRFVNAGERGGRDTKAKTTFHNNRAGRQVFEKEASSLCKCHGLSGSCTMQTCWRTPPSIRSIGDSLKEQYDGAIRVTIDPAGRLIPVNQLQKKPNKLNLVYYEDSPDFCSPNPSKGSLGTAERSCNATSENEDSCDLLCCGRGWDSVHLSVPYRCECHFRWCCEVICNECTENRVESHCKPNRSKRRINLYNSFVVSSYTKKAKRDTISDQDQIISHEQEGNCTRSDCFHQNVQSTEQKPQFTILPPRQRQLLTAIRHTSSRAAY